MLRTIFIFLKSLTLFLLFITNLYAEELTIIPIKKPVLDKITKQQKIEQGIIRPKSKPNLKIKDIKISNDIIIPETKPNKKDEIIKTEIVEEGIKKIEITPNNVVKKKNLILFF